MRKFLAGLGVLVILGSCAYVGYDRYKMQQMLLVKEFVVDTSRLVIDLQKQRIQRLKQQKNCVHAGPFV